MIKASINSVTIVNHISIFIQLKKCDTCMYTKHVHSFIYYTQSFNEMGGAMIKDQHMHRISMYYHISSLLHVSALQGAIFREFSVSLLNCCTKSWKHNRMRAVYCDRLCGGWDVSSWRSWNIPTPTQTVTIYSPHSVLLSRLWATIQQALTELPEDGALKHWNTQQWANVLMHWYSMHVLVLYLAYDNAWSKLQNGWSYFAPMHNRINTLGFVLLPDDEKWIGLQKRRFFKRKWGDRK
jgi:hypothetical protein